MNMPLKNLATRTMMLTASAARRSPVWALAAAVVALAPTSGCDQTAAEGEFGAPEYRAEQPAPVDDGNDLVKYVAQCEAVLGKIPQISCDPAAPTPGTKVTRIPVLFNGLPLGFADTPEDDEILAQRAADEHYTCDFPSIGGDFSCTVGSTLVQYEDPNNPNVQWVGLCRGVGRDNPGYDRFIGNGLIGANSQTGEMCFFFGKNPTPEAPYELPHLTSAAESAEALAPWVAPRDMPGSCLSCHPNNDPWILTPWLQPSYMQSLLTDSAYPLHLPDGVAIDDLMAARHVRQTPPQLKTLLPQPLPAGRTGWTEEEIFGEAGEVLLRQYRAVGSSYVDNEARGLVDARTGIRPDSWSVNFRERLMLQPIGASCSNGCHALANENFERLAHDSLGEKYATKYITAMMDTASVPGFAWMPPLKGSLSNWRAMFEAGEPAVPAITECPLPKQVDTTPTIAVACDEGAGGRVDISWRYDNDFGDVPGRDDIRFDIALGADALAPADRGVSPTSDREGVRMEATDAGTTVLRDVAAAPDAAGHYRISVPFTGVPQGLVIDLQPKRFCFEEPDRRPFAYAPPHRVEVDLAGECG